jgi:hypothetical protein
MDISPKTKEGIVDISIHEESHVKEILDELIQRFGGNESTSSLKSFLIGTLEGLARSHEIEFYEYDYSSNTSSDVASEKALELLHGSEVWKSDHRRELHVYRAST